MTSNQDDSIMKQLMELDMEDSEELTKNKPIDMQLEELMKCRGFFKRQKLYRSITRSIKKQEFSDLKKNKTLAVVYYNWVIEFYDAHVKEIRMEQDLALVRASKNSQEFHQNGNDFVIYAQKKSARKLEMNDIQNLFHLQDFVSETALELSSVLFE